MVVGVYMKKIQMGLGEALNRLLELEFKRRSGLHSLPNQAREERDLILNALNVQQLDLGFDCNGDGIVDTVGIFEQAVATSCCRLNVNDNDVRKPKSKNRLKALVAKSRR